MTTNDEGSLPGGPENAHRRPGNVHMYAEKRNLNRKETGRDPKLRLTLNTIRKWGRFNLIKFIRAEPICVNMYPVLS